MNAKSDYFLKEFLKPIDNTDDNIAIRLSILFTLKQIAPQKFKTLNLDQYLDGVILEIKALAEKPTSRLQNVFSKIKGIVAKSKKFYGLQTKLDYWYYTKLLGYEDTYKVDSAIINKFITDDTIRNVVDPKDAVMLYIYVRTLSYCDSDTYGQFKKYISHLKAVAQKDDHLYAYFLTHVILYDTQFGQKPAPQSSYKALKELEDFCENHLRFERENVDLMSEIIICCKLCNAYDFPFYSKLIQNIMPTENFLHYHEKGVLSVATFEWEST